MKAICFVVLFFASLSFGQPLPDGGVRLIQPEALTPGALSVRLGSGGIFGSKQVQAREHASFSKSLWVKVTKRPPQTWDAGIRAKTTGAVNKGDAILVGFWARGRAADGSGGGVAEFVFERRGNPYTKSIQYLVETPLDGSWRHFWIRFRSLEDYAPGGAQVNFQMGYLAAEFELAGFEVWNFRQQKLEALPHRPLSYVGRGPDAPWRAEAAKRIDQHRKGDMIVTLFDAAGRPLAGREVRVKLDRIDFGFGTCVKAKLLAADSPESERYRKKFLELFNVAVIENGLKWKVWDAWPSKHKETVQALDWLNEHQIPVRGHVMVWPGWRYLPPSLKQLESQPEKLREAIDTHIREIGTVAGDKVRDWDVLNEVFANRDLTRVLGDREMIRWFEQARAVAPKAKLYYNDYAGLVRGGFPTGHKQHFEETIRYLKDNGAPIDGIGIQGHFGSLLTPPHRLLAELDRWSAFGLDLAITEFDVTVPGAELRADFTRDFLTVCFSHPDVKAVLTWGFWGGAHWKPESALFTEGWETTPMGRQWIELTTQTWTTDETLTTDADGRVRLRGFLGQYSLIADGTRRSVHHGADGSSFELRK